MRRLMPLLVLLRGSPPGPRPPCRASPSSARMRSRSPRGPSICGRRPRRTIGSSAPSTCRSSPRAPARSRARPWRSTSPAACRRRPRRRSSPRPPCSRRSATRLGRQGRRRRRWRHLRGVRRGRRGEPPELRRRGLRDRGGPAGGRQRLEPRRDAPGARRERGFRARSDPDLLQSGRAHRRLGRPAHLADRRLRRAMPARC